MRNCGNFRNGVKHLYIQFFGLSDDIRSFGVCSFSLIIFKFINSIYKILCCCLFFSFLISISHLAISE